MWIVFEIDDSGLGDELVKVVGPFPTEIDASAYCTIHGLSGVFKVETPIVDRERRDP